MTTRRSFLKTAVAAPLIGLTNSHNAATPVNADGEELYLGRPLNHWLNELPNGREHPEIGAAITAFGVAAVPQLVAALKEDGRWGPATRCLVDIGVPAVPTLLSALKHKDLRHRLGAARVLIDIITRLGGRRAEWSRAKKEAIAIVNSGLRNEDPTVRSASLRAMCHYRFPVDDPEKAAACVQGLEDEDCDVRRTAEEFCHSFINKRMGCILRKRLSSPDCWDKVGAAVVLQRVGASLHNIIPVLAEVVKDSRAATGPRRLDATARETAAYLLGTTGKPALPALRAVFREADPALRANILESLLAADQAILPLLIEGLGDRDAGVREAAAQTIGFDASRKHDKKAIPALEKLLADARPRVRVTAAWALARIDPDNRDLYGIFAAELDNEDVETRILAIKGLWAIGPKAKRAVPVLLKLLKEPELRETVIPTMASIGPAAGMASAALLKFVCNDDVDKGLLSTVAFALGKIGAESVRPVAELMKRESPQLRARALYVLKRIAQDLEAEEERSLVPILRVGLTDAAVDVRAAAADAFIQIGPEAREALLDLWDGLKDPDLAVRTKVAAALATVLKENGHVPRLRA